MTQTTRVFGALLALNVVAAGLLLGVPGVAVGQGGDNPVNAPPVNAPPDDAPPVNNPPVGAPPVNAPPVDVPPENPGQGNGPPPARGPP